MPVTLAWVPTMARMSVDLPQPEGPSRPVTLAAGDVEVEVVEDRAAAADDGEVRAAWTAGADGAVTWVLVPWADGRR